MPDAKRLLGVSDYIKEHSALRLENERLRIERDTLKSGVKFLQKEIAELKHLNTAMRKALDELAKKESAEESAT